MNDNLVPNPVEVRRLISAAEWGADNLEHLSNIAEKLADEMIEATRRATDGIPAALESIALRHIKHENGDVEMIARWCPDPGKGVALMGGPMDGAMLALPRHHETQMPPAEFLGATMTAPKRRWMEKKVTQEQALAKLEATGAVYVRAGIDKHFDRWVYIYDPTN